MPRLRRSTPANEDLIGIWEYIAADNPEAATGVLRKLDAAMQRLAHHPELGEQQDHLRTGLRRFVSGNYLIFYEVTGNDLIVIRILHGARQWEDEISG